MRVETPEKRRVPRRPHPRVPVLVLVLRAQYTLRFAPIERAEIKTNYVVSDSHAHSPSVLLDAAPQGPEAT